MARRRFPDDCDADSIATIVPPSIRTSTGAFARSLSVGRRTTPSSTALIQLPSVSAPSRLGLVYHADVGGDDAPAFGEPDPRLHLPANLARRIVSPEERSGDGAIAAVGHDARPLKRARQADWRTGCAERLDRFVAIEVLASSVPDRILARREEAIERGDIVPDQRALVGCKGRFHLRL